ncbi:MAG: shikimate dehydrogenase [Lachnospiraceae bacterium]|nr:shikimate dehydrogenase [Lachnospiraceae bacterium]
MSYQITGHTKLGGLLGTPVAHSISPMMYNETFRLLGIDYVYLCFDTAQADLGNLVHALRDMQVFGFNLTMPDKERIIEYLDDLSPAARMIGAVNTVKNENGRLIGHNTDGIGYMRSVADHEYDIKSGAMTLLGAGGAASSIAIQAALDGVPALHIVNRKGRSWNNALRLADEINRSTSCHADVTDLADETELRQILSESRLLTNATSIGMAANAGISPIKDSSMLHPELLVSDIIYNPRRTKLMEDAESAGCRTFNGMYMLLYQGEAAFRIWTGQDMPVEAIREKYFS